MWGVSVERGNAAEGEVAASRETEVSVPLPTEWTVEGNRAVSTRGGEERRGGQVRNVAQIIASRQRKEYWRRSHCKEVRIYWDVPAPSTDAARPDELLRHFVFYFGEDIGSQ